MRMARSIDEESMVSLQAAARWVVGAAAAVGAILVAGLQVGTLGRLPVHGLRLPVAVAAVILGLLSIAFVIAKASSVLTSPRVSLVQLRDRELEGGRRASPGAQAPPDFDQAARQDKLLQEIHSHRHLLILTDATGPHDVYYKLDQARKAKAERGALEEDAQRLSDFASLYEMRRRFRSLLRWLIGSGLAIGIAVVSFSLAVGGSQEVRVTRPFPVMIVFTGTTNALQAAGVPGSCRGSVRGVAVGGELAEPEVVTLASGGCPPMHLVVTSDIGVALPT
jgi:hypothetical protein